jgi:hypothetical protein
MPHVRFAVDADSIGQFTGLKDKKGVDIYMGDIVRFKVGSGPVVIYPVTWERNAAQWIKGQCALSSYQKNTEIIGTTYENPELLK